MATKEITEDSKIEGNETGKEIADLESDIQKAIANLDYYTEQVDELIEIEDYKEMKVITSRVVEGRHCVPNIFRSKLFLRGRLSSTRRKPVNLNQQ